MGDTLNSHPIRLCQNKNFEHFKVLRKKGNQRQVERCNAKALKRDSYKLILILSFYFFFPELQCKFGPNFLKVCPTIKILSDHLLFLISSIYLTLKHFFFGNYEKYINSKKPFTT